MADSKTSALAALTGAGTATGDKIPIDDVSATTLKSITVAQLWVALGLLNVQSAYTQTYSTTAKTVPNATSAAVTATGGSAPAGGTGATAGAWDTAGHRDTAITVINGCVTDIAAIIADNTALRADVLALKKVIGALIDDLQALGLVG